MSSPNDGKEKIQVVYPEYTHRLVTWLEFTKYGDALWIWKFKAVSEQGSISRKEK